MSRFFQPQLSAAQLAGEMTLAWALILFGFKSWNGLMRIAFTVSCCFYFVLQRTNELKAHLFLMFRAPIQRSQSTPSLLAMNLVTQVVIYTTIRLASMFARSSRSCTCEASQFIKQNPTGSSSDQCPDQAKESKKWHPTWHRSWPFFQEAFHVGPCQF